MLMDRRVELVAGVCPVVYRENDPYTVLVVQEKTAKELTGKYAGMWGLGYETVEDGETHQDAIKRFFNEEVKPRTGRLLLSDSTNTAEIAIVRISPPEKEAWVHAYECPVSDDFEVNQGEFVDEIGDSAWINIKAILSTEGTQNHILFKGGTYEIAKEHAKRIRGEQASANIYFYTSNIPDWRLYRLLEQGISQSEALSQLRIDQTPLINYPALIRSLLLQSSP